MLQTRVEGQQRLEQIVRNLDKNLDTEKLLDEIAAEMFNRMRTRFLAQLDPLLHKWPVSKAALLRAKKGRGGGTLFDTGKLFHSLQLFSEGPGVRAIGTDVYYAKYHQYGTKALPQRQFLGFGPQDILFTEALAIKRLSEALVA